MILENYGAGLALSLISKDKPLKILDIGPGLGYWGFMLKVLLDHEPHLTGVELNPDTIARLKRLHLYDLIYEDDARRLGEWFEKKYDTAILSHFIEHIPKRDGIALLKSLSLICDQIIVLCPEGDTKTKSTIDIEGSAHVSAWTMRDFEKLSFRTRHIRYSIRAGRVVTYFEKIYFKLKGLKRGGVLVAWWG
jgi:SAM-dependent methyltransferase